MTIGSIVVLVVIAVIGLGITTFCIYAAKSDGNVAAGITGAVVFVITVALCFAIAWWQLNTESGKRALKTQQSNLNGGITRCVTVYDVEGDEIARYTGKFDVEHTDDRIMFDDETGKRHVIYYTTGTITVDEIE